MTDRRCATADGRAVSEVLGYVLVFSVVVLTVVLVATSGQAGLTDLRDAKRTENVEAGFAVLADNVDDVVREGVPSRATELALSGETAALGDPVTVTVNATDDGTGTVVFDRSVSLRPVVYRSPDGAELVYAAGAVIVRGEGGGVAMVRRPRMALDADWSVLPVANTSLDRQQLRGGAGSVDRESRVLLRTERRGRPTVLAADGTVNLTVTVESPRAAAWESYLESAIPSGGECRRPADDTVSCTYRTDRATVVLTRVAVSIE